MLDVEVWGCGLRLHMSGKVFDNMLFYLWGGNLDIDVRFNQRGGRPVEASAIAGCGLNEECGRSPLYPLVVVVAFYKFSYGMLSLFVRCCSVNEP